MRKFVPQIAVCLAVLALMGLATLSRTIPPERLKAEVSMAVQTVDEGHNAIRPWSETSIYSADGVTQTVEMEGSVSVDVSLIDVKLTATRIANGSRALTIASSDFTSTIVNGKCIAGRCDGLTATEWQQVFGRLYDLAETKNPGLG